MGTKLNKIPSNETELNKLIQDLYITAKENYDNDKVNCFTGMLEVIASEPNIISSIHKIKANKGSNTPGIDGKTMNDYLKQDYEMVIKDVKEAIYNYQAHDIRRVYIPKHGKNDMRPLGIPTIIDRIIQQCIKMRYIYITLRKIFLLTQ